MTFKPVETKLTKRPENITQERLTNMAVKTNVASAKPTSIRFTQNELMIIQDWLNQIQSKTNKNITLSKLMRGLVHMKDRIDHDELIDSIQKNT